MIDVTVVVPESRLAEFYENHGKWLTRATQSTQYTDIYRRNTGVCHRDGCEYIYAIGHGRKYCSDTCKRVAAQQRRSKK